MTAFIMTIRVATPADIPAMHRVRLAVTENRLSTPDRVTPEDYVPAISDLGRGWVAVSGEEVVGFAVGFRSGNIWALFVDPAHEGHGHGKALHSAMVDWLWAQGLSRLWLTTGVGTRAEAFYGRLGWQACGMEGSELRFELCRTTQGVVLRQ